MNNQLTINFQKCNFSNTYFPKSIKNRILIKKEDIMKAYKPEKFVWRQKSLKPKNIPRLSFLKRSPKLNLESYKTFSHNYVLSLISESKKFDVSNSKSEEKSKIFSSLTQINLRPMSHFNLTTSIPIKTNSQFNLLRKGNVNKSQVGSNKLGGILELKKIAINTTLKKIEFLNSQRNSLKMRPLTTKPKIIFQTGFYPKSRTENKSIFPKKFFQTFKEKSPPSKKNVKSHRFSLIKKNLLIHLLII